MTSFESHQLAMLNEIEKLISSGLSQTDAANKIGVSCRTFYNWRTWKKTLPPEEPIILNEILLPVDKNGRVPISFEVRAAPSCKVGELLEQLRPHMKSCIIVIESNSGDITPILIGSYEDYQELHSILGLKACRKYRDTISGPATDPRK